MSINNNKRGGGNGYLHNCGNTTRGNYTYPNILSNFFLKKWSSFFFFFVLISLFCRHSIKRVGTDLASTKRCLCTNLSQKKIVSIFPKKKINKIKAKQIKKKKTLRWKFSKEMMMGEGILKKKTERAKQIIKK